MTKQEILEKLKFDSELRGKQKTTVIPIPNLEAVFIGGNIELARQIFANQGDVFAACP